jgi:NADH-quinone oxidoreductase subunit L
MTATYAAWIALASPLAGLAFTIAIGSSVSRRTVGVIASGAILGGFVASCVALVSLLRRSPDQRVELSTGWHWLSAGRFDSHVSILVDPLSVIMLLVVTGVGFLIHAYSIGYMHGDREERRFFAYLNLFVFSMLLLVLAGDFVILLAGWGLVGLSSYLLIGFWWERPAAVAAAKKAFIMNAIGDIGIALGIFVIWNHVHSTDYLTVFGQAGGAGIPIGSHTANWIALLLLVGAVAKSAQLPLQTWLPDAMEGPTALHGRARRVRPGRADRRRDPHDGWADRPRADGHQARDRVLDDVADRVHVLRGRHRRVLGRHLPPADARLLQGAPVPRGGRRDPRARR